MDKKKVKTDIIAIVILMLYPLRHVNVGIDLMDAGYALGNYRYFEKLNMMWKLATYLSNVMGVLLSRLPGGDTWLGMNIYCGLLTGIAAVAVYLYLCKIYENRYLIFIGELTALSLCWAPNVILYHYLGYLLMTAAAMVLYNAIISENRPGFAIAGVILGVSVAVRMPNVTYMAFIIPLWYFCFIKKEKFGKLMNKMLYCIGGYAAGIIAAIGAISIIYGITAYPEMIVSLFGVTETAADYKPTSMLAAMFGDYASYSIWLLLFMLYGIAAVIALKAEELIFKNKIANVIKILYFAGMAVLLRFCYGRGMFDFDYTGFFSMYKWVTVYLLVVIIVCICTLISGNMSEKLKLWAVFILVTVFITPLGSNNGLYPIMNNLFLTAPLSLVLLVRLLEGIKGKMRFAVVSCCIFILTCTAVQSNLFGLCFVFHEQKPVGEKRVEVELKCSNVLDGMRTTVEKKQALEGLDSFLYENELNEKQLILYGDIPAVSYIFDMEPAVFTTWADLESNRITLLEEDLKSLYEAGEAPVVIFGKEALENRKRLGKADEKCELIRSFMEMSGYGKVYENSMFEVFST